MRNQTLQLLLKHLPGKHPQKAHAPKDSSLGSKLNSQEVKGKIASAAQAVIDEWEQDEEGFDEEFGGGGACDRVCDVMGDVIVQEVDADIYEGGQPGDEHAWLIAHDSDTGKAYGVDIDPNVYEQGGGYSWRKLQDINIKPTDVDVWEIDNFEPDNVD